MKPWRILKSQYLLRDRWITVRADICQTAEGVTVDPYYVLEYPDWVHIIAFDSAHRVLITRQYRHGAGKICTEIPCGMIEPGEAPVEAARRELSEETGCSATDIIPVGRFYPNPATHTNTVHCFLSPSTLLTGIQSQDESENIAFEFVPVRSVLEMIEAGEFSQGLHIASLMLGLRSMGLLKGA